MSAAHHDVSIERTYLKIFFVLFALTVFEVGITYLPIAKWVLAVGLVSLAFFKAGLVAAYYMHLKLEGRLLHLICAIPIVLVTMILAGLTPDIGRRIGAKTKQDAPPAAAHGEAAHGAASPAPSASPAH